MSNSPTILTICTGNVCRSPVVEVLLKKRFAEKGLDDWSVHSAGTGTSDSRPASQFSVEIIQEIEDIDLTSHRSRTVTAEMVHGAKLIICMEAAHKKMLSLIFPNGSHKIYLLSEMVSGPRFDVPDPYGQDKQVYRSMVSMVTSLIDCGFDHIVELACE